MTVERPLEIWLSPPEYVATIAALIEAADQTGDEAVAATLRAARARILYAWNNSIARGRARARGAS